MEDFICDLAVCENNKIELQKQAAVNNQRNSENGDIDDFIFADEEYYISQR